MSFTESLEELVASNDSGLLQIHPKWTRVSLAEICSILNGFPFPSNQFKPSGGKPLIRIRDVIRGWSETNFIGKYHAEYVVNHGDLVLGMDGDFKCALWAGEEALLNQRVCKLTPDERYYNKRLLAFVLPGYLDAINARTSSITVKHLSSTTVAEIPLPLPPLQEQSRLVQAIESYFTRLDNAAAMLEKVQQNLKRYRAAVLKAAVEGRLVPTEAELARAEGRDYESALALVDRIAVNHRRTRAGDGTCATGTVPEGWAYVTLGQVATRIDGGNVTTAINEPTSRRVLRSSAVRQRSIDFYDFRFLPDDEPFSESKVLVEGDLLFTRLSGTLAYVGNCAVVPALGEQRFEFPDRIFRARVDVSVSPDYIALCFGVAHLRLELERAAKSSAGHQRISLSDLRGFKIPLPPVAEQFRIVAEVDRLFSIADMADGGARENETRLQRLRQSILKWAFAGRLVGQDPIDEPASVLLERIKAERKESPGSAKRKIRQRKGNTTNA